MHSEPSLIPRGDSRSRMPTAPITRGQRPYRNSVATGYQNLGASDWINKGGLGSPQRRFGHFFAEEKVTRARAGEARQQSTGAE